jgi:putative copper resistance protein D
LTGSAVAAGIWPFAARFCFLTLMLGGFGAALFAAAVAPRALRDTPHHTANRLRSALVRLHTFLLAAAVVAAVPWMILVAAGISAAPDLPSAIAALPAVVADTLFGQLALAQVALLAAAAAAGHFRSGGVSAVLAGLACLLQTGHLHAWSEFGRPTLVAAAACVHVLAAGAWLGGLPPLLLMVALGDARVGALAARWFSPLGKWCVAGTVGSAAVQYVVLIGGLGALIGTFYGRLACAKMVLFGALFGLAVLNRYGLAPALNTGGPPARSRLLASLAVQIGVGLATVAVACALSALPPPARGAG